MTSGILGSPGVTRLFHSLESFKLGGWGTNEFIHVWEDKWEGLLLPAK